VRLAGWPVIQARLCREKLGAVGDYQARLCGEKLGAVGD
jgi:hypothetical protein